jgi:hypothetical protein
VNLEHELKYTQISTRPASTAFTPGPVVINRLLFVLLALFWAYAVFSVPLGS